MQVALNGFAGSFLLVWIYGRLRQHFAGLEKKEAGLVPFALLLALAHAVGASPVLLEHGLLPAAALVLVWGMGLELTGQGSSRSMLIGDALGAAALVFAGLQVSYLTAPSGGYIYLHTWAAPMTWGWVVAFVALLKLANRLPGLFTGVMALLSYLLMGSLLYQQQHPVADFRVVALLAGVSTGMWFNDLMGQGSRMGRIACSLWALTLGATTVLSTSKKVATVAVLSPVGLGLAPLFFFSYVIFSSYFLPRLTRRREERQFLALSLSRERLVGVMLLFCLLVDLFLLMLLFVPSRAWAAGLAVSMAIVYLQVVRLVLFAPARSAPSEDGPVEVLGLRFWARSAAEHLEMVRGWLRGRREPHWVVTPDSLALLRAQEERPYRAILEQADLVLPDGAGVIWAADFLHERPVLERTPGVEFVQRLCGLAAEEGASVFLLGTTDEVLDKAAASLQQRFPGLQVAGTQHGFFPAEDSPEVAECIRQSGADLVFVAMGVPKQEYWIRDFGDATGARLLMGVGGSLDVLSGTLTRAPQSYQRLGLEWLYRTLLEPRRLLRALQLPRFVLKVLEAKLRHQDA